MGKMIKIHDRLWIKEGDIHAVVVLNRVQEGTSSVLVKFCEEEAERDYADVAAAQEACEAIISQMKPTITHKPMDWIHWTYLGLIIALCVMVGFANAEISDLNELLTQCEVNDE
jgi:hypothetical protein